MTDRGDKGSNIRRTVTLSMRASLLQKSVQLKHLMEDFPLHGCIASIEDHGYVINTGLKGVTAFLAAKDVPKASTLLVGQPVETTVASVNVSARMVVVKIHRKKVIAAVTRGTSLTFNALTAGMLVDCVVKRTVEVSPPPTSCHTSYGARVI